MPLPFVNSLPPNPCHTTERCNMQYATQNRWQLPCESGNKTIMSKTGSWPGMEWKIKEAGASSTASQNSAITYYYCPGFLPRSVASCSLSGPRSSIPGPFPLLVWQLNLASKNKKATTLHSGAATGTWGCGWEWDWDWDWDWGVEWNLVAEWKSAGSISHRCNAGVKRDACNIVAHPQAQLAQVAEVLDTISFLSPEMGLPKNIKLN